MSIAIKTWSDQTAGISNFSGLELPANKKWQICKVVARATKGKPNFDFKIHIGNVTYSHGFSLENGQSKTFTYPVNYFYPISVEGRISRPVFSFSGAGAHITLEVTYDAILPESRKWMKDIVDGQKISRISIPGTHETCARVGGPWVECQDWDIPTQLSHGVRFLDIRCRHFNNAFTIHHGLVYQKINFGTVLDQCEKFLQSFPSECILMSVKDEYTSEGCTRSFNETFDDYVSKRNPDLWYLKNQFPTLGDVRGKIVILNRFGGGSSRGIRLSGWGDDTTSTITVSTNELVRVQDRYNYDTINGKTNKWNAISNLLNEAKRDTTFKTLYLNFGSATGLGKLGLHNTPRHVANDINPMLYDYLMKQRNGMYGTLIMDYPYASLINSIIATNF